MTRNAVEIRIEDLHLSFGATEVLRGVNMVIEPGEFYAFLGPSGSGKSTLLRAIAGFGPTPGGRILIGGRDIAKLPPWKRNVGMVFQSYALWPHMSVRANVAFGLEERKVPRRQIDDRVEAALELVGLQHLADRMPSQLSGGQQQRVALARTVVIEPDVLLLDEPLSNLDASLRIQMRRELLSLQRKLGLTTIFVTHDQEEANTTADRMAVLDGGVIQQMGTPQELYDNPANLFVAKFLGTANIIDGTLQRGETGDTFTISSGEVLHLKANGSDGSSIVLRPQNIEIVNGEGGADLISGKVKHREFLGSQTRYLVEAAGSQLIIDQKHVGGVDWYEPGMEVKMSVNTQNAVLL
ncbi:ABC transporter ATP-binding protein [Roseibium sp.]|uniref:ABC transporter ATP-binding protein n=1 Tax=Roseibium sp. TaxID=1936156 RepID=UPI003D0A5186